MPGHAARRPVSTDQVVLRFSVPSEDRPIFDHELALLLDQIEPLISWLQRHGGQLQMR